MRRAVLLLMLIPCTIMADVMPWVGALAEQMADSVSNIFPALFLTMGLMLGMSFLISRAERQLVPWVSYTFGLSLICIVFFLSIWLSFVSLFLLLLTGLVHFFVMQRKKHQAQYQLALYLAYICEYLQYKQLEIESSNAAILLAYDMRNTLATLRKRSEKGGINYQEELKIHKKIFNQWYNEHARLDHHLVPLPHAIDLI